MSKKRPGNDSILDYIIKTEASNVDKPLIISITNELINQNLIENKKTRQGLDSLHLVKLSDTGNIQQLCRYYTFFWILALRKFCNP